MFLAFGGVRRIHNLSTPPPRHLVRTWMDVGLRLPPGGPPKKPASVSLYLTPVKQRPRCDTSPGNRSFLSPRAPQPREGGGLISTGSWQPASDCFRILGPLLVGFRSMTGFRKRSTGGQPSSLFPSQKPFWPRKGGS